MSEASIVEGPSAGTLLRRGREAQGLHVAALAVSLKVPVRKIEALEQDRLDELPDAVFARALASSVCRTLKIDPRPILDRLPQGSTPRLGNDRAAINTPFRAPGDAAPATWKQHLTRPVSLVVIALLVGAVVLVFVPLRRDEPAMARQEGAPGVPMAAVVTQAPSAVDVPAAAASAPAEQVAAAPVAQPSVVVPLTASTELSTAPAASAPAPAVQVPADGAVPATGTVVFRTRGPSWVEVTDAKGVVTLRRLMGPGDTAGASGAQPLAITVGSVRDTTVEVRGKPFDLAPVSKDNVARFEVK